MRHIKTAFLRLWTAHTWFRIAFVLSAFGAPWLLLATSPPDSSPIGVLVDLAVVTVIGSTIVYASWEGFSAVAAKARGVVAFVATMNLVAAEFAYAYWSVAQQNVGAFTEPLDKTSAAYLSVGTFTTVEVGGLAPLSSAARLVATAQMGFGLAAVAVGLTSVVGANTRRQRESTSRSV